MAAKELYLTPLTNDANLVSYWRFEGNSNDTKGSYNGSASNVNYSTSYGKFGQGANFNGSSSKITLGTGITVGNGDFTLHCVFKIGSFNGNNTIFSKRNDTGFHPVFDLHFYSNGTLEFTGRISGTETLNAITSPSALSTGTWYFVDITRSGSTCKMYINGELVSTNNSFYSGSLNQTSYGATIGVQNSGYGDEGWFNGYLDDLAYFTRALTPTEISKLYTGNFFKVKTNWFF